MVDWELWNIGDQYWEQVVNSFVSTNKQVVDVSKYSSWISRFTWWTAFILHVICIAYILSAMCIIVFRWIVSVYEGFGQGSSRSWFIYAIGIQREAASRTPNRPYVIWSTPRVTSQSDTPSTSRRWPPPTPPPTPSWPQSSAANSSWPTSRSSSRTPGSGN